MIFTPAQLIKEESPHWFCVRSQPKHEHVAAAALRRNLGLECFSPRIRFRKKTRRGPVWFIEAMFPGYLFSRFVYATQHRQVQYSAGVSSIVHFGTQVAAIDPATIAQLQTASGPEETVVFNPEPKVGEEVAIAAGPFQGLEVVVSQVLPAKERVKVLLTFLGRTVEAEIGSPDVIPAVSPRSAALGM